MYSGDVAAMIPRTVIFTGPKLALYGYPRNTFLKWLPLNDMPELNHKGDFPTQRDIAAFLKSLGKHDDVARAADIPSSTYIKWHRTTKPSVMGAEYLLRVVLALGAVDRFAAWLAKYGGTWHSENEKAPAAERPAPDSYSRAAAVLRQQGQQDTRRKKRGA